LQKDLFNIYGDFMQDSDTTSKTGFLEAGTTAPDFTLASSNLTKMSLADFRGKPLIIAFYPGDFSPVCGDQIALYNEVYPEFEEYGAQIIGISVDSKWCHAAFAKQKNLRFPLLADFEPKGEVARRYGAYRSKAGTSERALFVLDENGVIEWSYLSPVDVNPGADGILNALEKMRGSSGPSAEKESTKSEVRA
jgi:peroxiredoxin